MPGVARGIKKSREKTLLKKKVSQFGPVVWLAIANI